MDAVDRVEDELYRVPPEEFVAERDAHVARAKEAGDRETAKAIGSLRRPSRAAWLTNLLVHDRPDELEGLLGLADSLAGAQRSLDGEALRTISAQRNRLVGALARQAAALGREAGHRVDSTLEREVRTVLESALADPELAAQVRSGHLVRAERHAGFGPTPDEGAEPRPGRSGTGTAGTRDGRRSGGTGAGSADRAPDEPDPQRDRRDRELARARRDAERAREAAEQAWERHERARDEAEEAERRRAEARDRVAELSEELERARAESSEANRAAHTAASTEKDAARAARSAETARDRADAAVRDLEDG